MQKKMDLVYKNGANIKIITTIASYHACLPTSLASNPAVPAKKKLGRLGSRLLHPNNTLVTVSTQCFEVCTGPYLITLWCMCATRVTVLSLCVCVCVCVCESVTSPTATPLMYGYKESKANVVLKVLIHGFC